MSLAQICWLYGLSLTPIPPFTWLGASISTLDVLAALRLCAIMRQIREAIRQGQSEASEGGVVVIEESSFVKHACATLTVVYGGEVFTAAWLGQSPSFLIFPSYPLLYIGTQYFIESLPWIPTMMFEIEAPLTFLDAFTRSHLLTHLIPPAVLTHTDSLVSNSPWALLLISFVTANGGFFIVNLFSMLNPGGWYVATPAELKPYGWTTTDLWVAPLITGLAGLLTHAQPFWTYLHLSLVEFSRPRSLDQNPVKPWNATDARALGAVVLWVLFATRTVRTMGVTWWNTKPKKKEVMRSRVDGRRYPGALKSKKTE